MKPERKRALISISITLIIGILIGALTVGLLVRNAENEQRASRHKDSREKFVERILSVAEVNAEQAKQIRPYLYETMDKIDSLQKRTDRDVESAINALETKLTPILSKEQMEKLQQFHRKSRDGKSNHKD
jgi:hypothetical protein